MNGNFSNHCSILPPHRKLFTHTWRLFGDGHGTEGEGLEGQVGHTGLWEQGLQALTGYLDFSPENQAKRKKQG